MAEQQPFAAFDIDGTVIRWQLYHAIGDALAKAGHIEADAFETVREARMTWKRREDSEGFAAYEHRLVDVFDSALAGLSTDTFAGVVDGVFEEYKDQTYTRTRDLIRDLGGKGYLLFAVSGSPAQIVQKFADYYGFTDFAATTYTVQDGVFTGEKALSIGKKPQLLQALIDKHNATTTGSYAVGDSEGDIGMLTMVDNPIAFNPSQQLEQHARHEGWKIILERKNVVYELEPFSGGYKLV